MSEGIFPADSKITLSPGTVKRIVQLLEDKAFYGTGEDIKGPVYETFLRTLFRGDWGQYFTPREVVSFMVQLVDPKPSETIIDPACGSGGFLIQSFLDIRKKILAMNVSDEEKSTRLKTLVANHLWGVDKAEVLVQFCKINLLIHGDGYRNIHQSDSLDKQSGILSTQNEHFDVVMTNPPFDLPSEHLEHVINDYSLYKTYGYEGADVLFMERCYELCKPGGRIAIVVPHRFIDGTGFKNLRTWIKDRMVLRAIIVLPVGVFKPFGGSNARTSIVYLRKPKSEKEKIGPCLLSTIEDVGFETGIGEYKRIDQNNLEDLLASDKFPELKEAEEKIHGLR